MRIKFSLLALALIILSCSCNSQNKSMKSDSLNSDQEVYKSAIDYLYNQKNKTYIINTTVKNNDIAKWFYDQYHEALSENATVQADSGWIGLFNTAAVKVSQIHSANIPGFSAESSIIFLPEDSIPKNILVSGRGDYEGRGWVNGIIQLSSIAYSSTKDKAIVETAYYCGSLCGQGNLILLAKNKVTNKWEVIETIMVWIS